MTEFLSHLTVQLHDSVELAKALSTELRVAILEEIMKQPINVNEIAIKFDLPPSTAAINIRKLEEVGLIKTELVPGTRGAQKICRAVYGRIIVDIEPPKPEPKNQILLSMPIGHFSDCLVTPTCGLISEHSIIGEFDLPTSFYEPDRVNAQLIWFKQGYLEYRFPNKIPYGADPATLTLSMEICSEAPMYNPSWPSDITLWVNGVEVGTWTSPGDFGGERGVLTPEWWGIENTQFGIWKTWKISHEGSFIDGNQISNITLNEVALNGSSSISAKIGVKSDAVNVGGLNIFGKKMGNYNSDIVMRIDYSNGITRGKN
ncbi:ArsR/SmtB family transcription factor [Alicyclobacillus ferrooxydans]|uniref:ArsR family transcriptional regulator n=1 Tax=Alicyclobacillus ferrooxydans TaxID=471514 RepID=A0A0P9CDV0_9BACL|nr:helix-turn-helix domain-containing protein [Alicyclobacillus ferrooxydans]KPV43960.1 ArsR family transcriptional regulator [Alicyclobacillus ferrooxydans]